MPGPIGVEELSTRFVKSFVGVSAEVIALRLQQICRQAFVAVGVVKRQRSAERWDRNSLPARTGTGAVLEITDGAQTSPQSIPIDRQHLEAGVFTYGRQSGKVEVRMTVRLTDGREIREATTFLGPPPPQPSAAEDPEVRRQRDELAKEAAKLKSDLADQEKRTQKLERSLDDVQKTLREQQRRRMENQAPPK